MEDLTVRVNHERGSCLTKEMSLNPTSMSVQKGGSPSARPSRAVVIDAINEIKDASLAVLNQTNQSYDVT